jgi:asparagine N-glycosylation enzyme membrane subunit Stt3
MKKLLLFLSVMVVLSVMASHATASLINIASVTASSTYSGWDVNNIINGAGLNGSPPLHDEIANSNAWMSVINDTVGWLIFDLGSTYTVTSTDVWQYGHWNVHPRGVKDFQILSSINGIDYTFVADATLQKVSVTPNAAESFSLSTNARYIKFDIQSNWGGGNYTGLSEVQFNGSPVPIPGAIWLLGSGLLGLVAIRRRKENSD